MKIKRTTKAKKHQRDAIENKEQKQQLQVTIL